MASRDGRLARGLAGVVEGLGVGVEVAAGVVAGDGGRVARGVVGEGGRVRALGGRSLVDDPSGGVVGVVGRS